MPKKQPASTEFKVPVIGLDNKEDRLKEVMKSTRTRKRPTEKPVVKKPKIDEKPEKPVEEQQAEDSVVASHPPDTLYLSGVTYWGIICNQLEALGLLSESILLAVEQCCILYDECDELTQEIRQYGQTVMDEKGSLKINPAVTARASARRLINQYLSQMGLTPKGKQQLVPHGQGKPTGSNAASRGNFDLDDDNLWE